MVAERSPPPSTTKVILHTSKTSFALAHLERFGVVVVCVVVSELRESLSARPHRTLVFGPRSYVSEETLHVAHYEWLAQNCFKVGALVGGHGKHLGD